MLYFVATPIGNLKDMSFRAVETLNSVDEIYCEDTRHSLTLLNAYSVKKPLFSYHKFNEKECAEKIAEKLSDGKNIAVISDAGMPVISDPGNVLINLLIEKELPFTVIPGASAFVSALLLSGFPADNFCFMGFLPQKNKERKEFLSRCKNVDMTTVFYCAPHDIEKDIKSIYEVFGDRKAAAVKEITKIHESTEFFDLKDGLNGEIKGEYVLIVKKGEEKPEEISPEEELKALIASGTDKKEALKTVAAKRKVPKSSLYKYTIEKQ